MVAVFSAEEVLEIACQIERNGTKFYRDASALVQDDLSRRMLHDLATMEEGHEKTFDEMREDSEFLNSFELDPDGLASKYLGAIASANVFTKTDMPPMDKSITVEQVLENAIKAEMLSIAFYQGIREEMKAGVSRKKINSVIHEEMEHVSILSDKLKSL